MNDSFNPLDIDEDGKVQSKLVFLVTGSIEISEYMGGSKSKTIEKTHIVYAFSEEEAEDKFIKHYESKSSSYEVDYSVVKVLVNKTLF